jgi:hypothetical protein
MHTISLSTISVILLSTAANAVPATQATPPQAAAPVQLADATNGAAAVQTAPATAAPAQKPICKLLPSSYSHSSKRVCLTKEQWKQVDDQMRN